MNKKYTAFFEGYGMTVDKNSAYGKIHGYETNAVLRPLEMTFPLLIHISFYATDEQKRNMEFSIRNLALKFFNMQFSAYGLAMGFNDITNGRLIKRLPEVLEKIFAIISENGAMNADFCPVCGRAFGAVEEEEVIFPIDDAPEAAEEKLVTDAENQGGEVKAEETVPENAEANKPSAVETAVKKPAVVREFKKCNIDGLTITIDSDCVETINSVIRQENSDFENAPNNYFKGFLGAFIGGLAGVAVAIVLYAIGFISSISAIISIALGTFLYRKFHGKPNKIMIVIVSLTTFVMMIASVVGIYIVSSGIAAAEVGVPMTAIEAFGILMQDSEFSGMFYADLCMVILFTVIGIVVEIFVMAKGIKRRKNI